MCYVVLGQLCDGSRCFKQHDKKMKIDKKLIKELVDHLSEFNLAELEYQSDKIKVSKATKGIED